MGLGVVAPLLGQGRGDDLGLAGCAFGPSEVWSQSCLRVGRGGVLEVELVPADLDDLVQEQLVVVV